MRRYTRAPHLRVLRARAHDWPRFDIRLPNVRYPIANGVKRRGKAQHRGHRSPGWAKCLRPRALSVRARGMKTHSRAIGQTGILMAGRGVLLHAVRADFMAGAVHWLTPDNNPVLWDLSEGKGRLFHCELFGCDACADPSRAPDALIICDAPTRALLCGLAKFPLSKLEDRYALSLTQARLANPACLVAGVAANIHALEEKLTCAHCAAFVDWLGVPATDPFL